MELVHIEFHLNQLSHFGDETCRRTHDLPIMRPFCALREMNS